MEFRLTIECDNAAFEQPAPELTRLLRRVAHRIDTEHEFDQQLIDLNGNTVGSCTMVG